MNWLLDPSVSTFGPEIDGLYYLILIITGAVFVLTELLLIYFLIKYRAKEGRRADYIHGSTKAEVIWTTIPFVIVVALALISVPVWDRIKDPANVPADSYEIHVSSRQFEWEATYPGEDGVFGTDADFSLLNRINVPANQPVVIHLESEDVIHSFFVPDFRLKQDAMPGMVIPVWFEVTEPGEYALGCAELCGFGHYSMNGVIVVQSEEEFAAWEEEQFASRRPSGGSLAADVSEEDRNPLGDY